MTQKDYVIKAMEENGGYATLQKLYSSVDTSCWGTKTPHASIRGIVQTNNKDFFRIEAGLWGLSAHKNDILRKLNIEVKDKKSVSDFTHGYMQGIITEIGNIKHYTTYVPPQDKNRMFLEKKLSDVATVLKIYEFTYSEILKFAKTVDVIWFNDRKLPKAFYEVEHTTNITNSLDKFYELQDFRASFYIVAATTRRNEFEKALSKSIYNEIRNIVKFVSFEDIVRQYEKESIKLENEIW